MLACCPRMSGKSRIPSSFRRSPSGRQMTRRVRLHLNYSSPQLFDLVADVERYPEFLPWVLAARVTQRQDATIGVDMTIGTSLLCKRFKTVAILERPHRIDIKSHDPLFDRFRQIWTFAPATDDGTDVEYQVDFEFRSRLLQALVGRMFSDQANETVAAFRRRARQLYGTPASSPAIR
jgi:coenzyme Q-binding protein COQ10